MSKKAQIPESQVVLTGNDILVEVNGIATALHLRTAGLTDEQKEITRTAQLIGLGALWLKFLSTSSRSDAARYTEIASELAGKLNISPLS